MFIERDGVALHYIERGSGGPTLVLAHCWGGDSSFFEAQLDYFSDRHRVIALDLRGHGESGAPEQAYTIDGYVDDLAWLCDQLGVSDAVLVGHSMGGNIALRAASRPGLASGVVILDSPVVSPPGLLDGFRPVLGGIQTEAWPQVMQGFYGQIGGFDHDPERKAWLLEHMSTRNHQHVLVSSLADLLDSDSDADAAACKVPVLYVAGGMWYTDVARFRELCPQLLTAQCVLTGHNLQLEAAAQLNPMIERFLAISLNG